MVHRVAVVDRDLCQSRKCGLECIKECPVNINGKECILLDNEAKAVISEDLCIGCGICIKVCPFNAIEIVNLAEEIMEDKVHQYGVNSFRLFKIPTVKEGVVTGLVGKNGTGKTTTLRIFSGQLIPNLGDYESEPSWDRFLSYLSGKEMKSYFQRLANDKLDVSVKPQEIYKVAELWKGDVRSLLSRMDQKGELDYVVEGFALKETLDKKLIELSGGELQRVVTAASWLKDADVYLFDEPSSFNDVLQRLRVSTMIKELAKDGKAVLVVEHDISFLDYVTDYVNIIYGEPGVYGIVSSLYPSRTGINALINGYLPLENIRFRNKSVEFIERTYEQQQVSNVPIIEYSNLKKTYNSFTLRVKDGRIFSGEVVGVIGANALGKTTFLKILSGIEKADSGYVNTNIRIAYKPQYISSNFSGTVEELVSSLGEGFKENFVYESLFSPMKMEKIMQRKVSELSGGELQKISIVATMSQNAEIYALDEPSAFLDVEDRFTIARAISRIVKAKGKSAVIIDHDLQLIDSVSDQLIVFDGTPGVEGFASEPLTKEEGMNYFLKRIGLTYRRDHETGRPRINKPGSRLDRVQKESGSYFYS